MGTRFSAPVQTGPEIQPASCTMGTGSFPGLKSGWGVTLTPNPLLVPWSRKCSAIPLLPLWDVRLVQSLSACTKVHFTFTLVGKVRKQVRSNHDFLDPSLRLNSLMITGQRKENGSFNQVALKVTGPLRLVQQF